MAATELQAIVRFRFHDGDVEEFKRLSAECMEIVRTQDTGTLQYDTYFNDDETECIVIERFRDSDALIQHGENLAHLMDAIIATGSVSGELLGEPERGAPGEVHRRRPGAALHALGEDGESWLLMGSPAPMGWLAPRRGSQASDLASRP